MEPSERNRWQPVASGSAESGSDRRKPLPWAATGCLRRSMGKEGVSGSSSEEGFTRKPRTNEVSSSQRSLNDCTPDGRGCKVAALVRRCLPRPARTRPHEPRGALQRRPAGGNPSRWRN